jgi:predicted nuclease of predicted toxin-antitoxin system
MNLLADENIDKSIVLALRAAGHSVEWIAEIASGVTDEVVLQRAVETKALLLTEDKDFGELIFRQRLVHHGVLLIRLDGLDNEAKRELVLKVIQSEQLVLLRYFTVLTPENVRTRSTSPFSIN